MNVAIDITPMHSGHKMRGVGSYTRLLKEALEKSKSNHTFHFFIRGEKLPRKIDLIHYPYFDPFFLTLPFFSQAPYVITVHDLIPLVYPDKFPPGIKGELEWRMQKFSLQRARRVITDSHASQKDICTIAKIASDKIKVIYLAPSPVFRPIRSKSILDSVRKRYVLPPKFVLFVGDVNWNKNIFGLLKACAILFKSKGFQDTKLILVGKPFLDEQLPEAQMIHTAIRDLSMGDSVMKLGFVPDEDLAAIYSLASVYVQPSYAEGFGFPVLEAMACGCPVVVSDTSSLSEIAGPALRVNPNDSSNIASGIEQILRNKKAQTLSKKGIAWAKNFSWEKVVQQTTAVYERAFRGDLR